MKNYTNKIAKTYFLLMIFSGALMINSCSNLDKNETKPVLLNVSDDPTISFKIWFKVGSQLDPKGKEGLAALTASMLTDGGTQNNTYEQIIEKLFPLAASYGAKVDKEMTVINGRTHKDNLEEYYKLLIDAITKPAFKEEDFSRIKSDVLNSIENNLRYSSDEELGKEALYGFIFSGTPYGHLTFGTIQSLKSITIDDVKQFYKKYYTKQNFVIGLGGGFEEKLINRLEDDLAKLPDGKIVQPEKPKPSVINGREVLLVEKNCDATAISFGFPLNILRNDEDFVALALFNSWFGEHRNQSSHLYQVLREKRGMNYGDYSYIETFLNGGSLNVPDPCNARRQQIFEVWLRPVPNQNRHFALRAAMRELQNVITNGLTKDQFELTKMYLYNYSLFWAPTTMMKLGYQIDSRFYGVKDNGNYIEYFREKLKSLTLEQVNAAIKKYIQFQNIKFAIVTKDAEAFRLELLTDGPSPNTYATPVPDEVLTEDKIIEIYPLQLKPNSVKIVKIDEMFQK